MTPGQLALRESVALSEKSHVVALRVLGREAWDAVDWLVPGELFAQGGRMRHTLILRDDGTPFADAYVCAGEEDDFLILAEGPSREELRDHLALHASRFAAEFQLLDDRGVIGVDGPFAWEALAQVLGPDVIGLPYLTFFVTDAVTCFRAGKTGEYGYDLLVPRAELSRWAARFEEEARAFDLSRCTLDDLDRCALENWFFNPRREGRCGATPLELQLQWRLSRRKDFVGAEALARRRREGVRERLVCLLGPGPFAVADAVTFDGRSVGRVVNAAPCELRREWIAMALVEVGLAHAGLGGFEVAGAARSRARTVAPPVLSNRSLFVQPQRHSWLTRAEVDWPALVED